MKAVGRSGAQAWIDAIRQQSQKCKERAIFFDPIDGGVEEAGVAQEQRRKV